MRRYLWHLAIVIVVLLSVTPANFARADHTDYHFWFAPPTAGAGNNAYLEQSWHENSKGLDWTAGGNYTTYLRGWGASSDGSSTPRAYVVLDDTYQLSGCKSVWADVYDLGDNWLDSVGYVHTEDMEFTGSHNLLFSSSWPLNSDRTVSTMVDPDNQGCPWEGIHVHETHYGTGHIEVSRNDCGTYCGSSSGNFWNTDWENWTRSFAW